MSKNLRHLLVAISLLIAFSIALAPSASAAAASSNETISFSDMKVKADGHEGWLGGRSVKVKIVGTVTNNTKKPITEDNLPVLTSIADDSQTVGPSLKEKELSPKDSCKVTYKGEIKVEGASAPSLTFVGTQTFTGLDEVEAALAEEAKDISADFESTDEKRAEKEEKRQKEEQEKKENHNIIEACVDKTADDALAAAQKTGYEPVFLDFYDVDVTEDVLDTYNGSEVHNAIVLKATPSDGWFLAGPKATFILDYTDPEAAQEREEEARRKEKEELRRKSRTEISDSVGKSVGKTQELVDGSAFVLVVLDSYGTDVTSEVRQAKKGSPIRCTPVTSVEIDEPWGSDTHRVLVSINFTGRTTLLKIAKEKGYPTDLSVSNIAVEVTDTNPAVPDPAFEVIVTGSITNNGVWAVDDVRLPRLTTPQTSFVSAIPMSLTEGNTKLNPSETCNFVLTARIYFPYDQLTLKTPKSIATIQNDSLLFSEVMAQLSDARQVHDENVEYYQEEQRRLVAEQMNNRVCYYTPNGSSYHSRTGCPALSRSKEIYETTVGQAQSWGLEPCDRCN